jgi:hypothetical protein
MVSMIVQTLTVVLLLRLCVICFPCLHRQHLSLPPPSLSLSLSPLFMCTPLWVGGHLCGYVLCVCVHAHACEPMQACAHACMYVRACLCAGLGSGAENRGRVAAPAGTDTCHCTVPQKLDVRANRLSSLPEELTCLGKLRELLAGNNNLPTVPFSILRKLSALTTISLCFQMSNRAEGSPGFRVSSPLLPILHPGLVMLDLTHHAWDALSQCHLGHAIVEVANRTPTLTVQYRRRGPHKS